MGEDQKRRREPREESIKGFLGHVFEEVVMEEECDEEWMERGWKFGGGFRV